jgi:hypothetical protein
VTPVEETERRRRLRFPIELPARYTVIGQRPIEGTGWTVNLSSHGALIESSQELSAGASVRVVIEWPVLLGNVRPLALHIRGKIVRSEQGLVAVAFSSYELRTQPKLPNQTLGVPNWLVRNG